MLSIVVLAMLASFVTAVAYDIVHETFGRDMANLGLSWTHAFVATLYGFVLDANTDMTFYIYFATWYFAFDLGLIHGSQPDKVTEKWVFTIHHVLALGLLGWYYAVPTCPLLMRALLRSEISVLFLNFHYWIMHNRRTRFDAKSVESSKFGNIRWLLVATLNMAVCTVLHVYFRMYSWVDAAYRSYSDSACIFYDVSTACKSRPDCPFTPGLVVYLLMALLNLLFVLQIVFFGQIAYSTFKLARRTYASFYSPIKSTVSQS